MVAETNHIPRARIEQVLEIAVPGGEALLAIEHRDPVAHIVEGDAQLGLALADLVQQPSIVHRDHGLCGKLLQQRDLFLGERPVLLSKDHEIADHPRVLVFLAAAVTILLGLIIVSHWPVDSIYVLGTLLGVDLLFHGVGWVSFGVGLQARA